MHRLKRLHLAAQTYALQALVIICNQWVRESPYSLSADVNKIYCGMRVNSICWFCGILTPTAFVQVHRINSYFIGDS
jgi:hypothetical protein